VNELLYRLGVLVWFLAYMATIYLVLHIVVARWTRAPESRLLWFFGVITGPLVAPIRALLPAGTPPSRLRWVALAVYAGLWLTMRVLLGQMVF
jgi:uncharacterized protein YggT (Ycf19 family)